MYFKYSLLDNSALTLLYDYSVEVGDTVNGNWEEFIVTEVDSEFAIGEDRKRITMENTYDGHIDIWLSGLVSKVAGYLYSGVPIFAADAGSEFSCYLNVDSREYYYIDKDPALYMLISTSSACMTTFLDIGKDIGKIIIFPNPANDFITIKLDDSFNRNIIAQLFSMDGKQIIYKKYDVDNLSMDISILKAGIYLLEINQNGNKSYHKIVIQ
ncbi:MAG: hypothetical protein ACJATI_005210 [Halioglobus sp.]